MSYGDGFTLMTGSDADGLMPGRVLRLAIALARSNARLHPRESDSKHQLLEVRPYHFLARLELLFFAEDALALPFFAVCALALLFFAVLFAAADADMNVLLLQIE